MEDEGGADIPYLKREGGPEVSEMAKMMVLDIQVRQNKKIISSSHFYFPGGGQTVLDGSCEHRVDRVILLHLVGIVF